MCIAVQDQALLYSRGVEGCSVRSDCSPLCLVSNGMNEGTFWAAILSQHPTSSFLGSQNLWEVATPVTGRRVWAFQRRYISVVPILLYTRSMDHRLCMDGPQVVSRSQPAIVAES